MIIILLIIILTWCWSVGLLTQWDEQVRKAYGGLRPHLGVPNQYDPEAGGGATWWKPNNLTVLNNVTLLDVATDYLHADINLRLFAGQECIPSPEAVNDEVKKISQIKGVKYCPETRGFQIASETAEGLLSVARQVTRVASGQEAQEGEPCKSGKLRAKLQKYSQYLKPVS